MADGSVARGDRQSASDADALSGLQWRQPRAGSEAEGQLSSSSDLSRRLAVDAPPLRRPRLPEIALGGMDSSKNEGAVAALPDDPLVEILSRVPARSICRFKCVCKAWRDLIADPQHRTKLRQAMQGLFFMVPEDKFSVSFGFIDLLAVRSVPLDIDPAFSFLKDQPGFQFHNLGLLDSCNGLVLFKNWEPPSADEVDYVVCNPTTKRWAAVPASGSVELKTCTYLAFDPAVSSHFHLLEFEIATEREMLVSLLAYSSEIGTWSDDQMDSPENQGALAEWYHGSVICRRDPDTVFVNGFLHFLVGDLDQPKIAVVDVQGKTRRVITVPGVAEGVSWFSYLGQSQGCLYYMVQKMYGDNEVMHKLSIWVLEDYDTQQWVLKGTVSSLEIFGHLTWNILYYIVGIHRDCNVVFFSKPCSCDLIAYDMDQKKVSVVATFKALKKPHGFAHYIPCFSESPALTD